MVKVASLTSQGMQRIAWPILLQSKPQVQQLRALCDRVKLDATSDDVADLFDRHLGQQQPGSGQTKGIASTRSEALHLYRKIQRYTALFDWPDENGELWRDKLRASARQEFEAARYEQDPQVVAKLLFTTSEAVEQIMVRFLKKRKQLEEEGKVPRRLGNPYQYLYDF